MSLLETAVATVLLGVAAVTCLASTREALAASRRGVAWHRAVAMADAALADAALGAGSGTATDSVRVVRRPYQPGIDLVEATVTLPGGGLHTVSRLVPRSRP